MIDHVILTVSDLKRSIDFYTHVLKSLGYLKTMDFKGEAGHHATWVFDPDGYDIEVVNKTGLV
jgi:extradiol dioxygenase family protein